jgi:hypothetical protein
LPFPFLPKAEFTGDQPEAQNPQTAGDGFALLVRPDPCRFNHLNA